MTGTAYQFQVCTLLISNLLRSLSNSQFFDIHSALFLLSNLFVETPHAATSNYIPDVGPYLETATNALLNHFSALFFWRGYDTAGAEQAIT